MMFAECGMEVYETIGALRVEDQSLSVTERNNDALRLYEHMERLQEKIYAIHEAMDQMNLEEPTCSERMEEWMGHMEETSWGGGVVPEVWRGLREGFCCYTGGTPEGAVVILLLFYRRFT